MKAEINKTSVWLPPRMHCVKIRNKSDALIIFELDKIVMPRYHPGGYFMRAKKPHSSAARRVSARRHS